MNMRRHNTIRVFIATLATSLAACSSVQDAMEGHQNVVASAAGYSLTIEKAAEFAAASIPQGSTPSALVIDAVTELWTSYILLATELTSPNGFSDVDVGPMIRGKIAQAMVQKLHDDIVAAQVDSSDAAMRAAYERDQPFTRVETSHILIAVSAAGEAEIDSLRRFASLKQSANRRSTARISAGWPANTLTIQPALTRAVISAGSDAIIS
jgi:hypothetical protein